MKLHVTKETIQRYYVKVLIGFRYATKLYLLFLCLLFFLDIDQLRLISGISHIDVEDETANQNINKFSILSKIAGIFDVYFCTHFLGWFMFHTIYRNYTTSFCASILWEVVEVYFTPYFPDFPESWWDSIVVDVVVCNGGGIYLGAKFCQYFELENNENYDANAIRTLQDLGKISWNNSRMFYRLVWDRFLSLNHNLIIQSNTFMMMSIFNLPANHYFIFARNTIAFWGWMFNTPHYWPKVLGIECEPIYYNRFNYNWLVQILEFLVAFKLNPDFHYFHFVGGIVLFGIVLQFIASICCVCIDLYVIHRKSKKQM